MSTSGVGILSPRPTEESPEGRGYIFSDDASDTSRTDDAISGCTDQILNFPRYVPQPMCVANFEDKTSITWGEYNTPRTYYTS